MDGQVELRDEAVGERGVAQPRETDRDRRLGDLDPGTGRQVHGTAAVAPDDPEAVRVRDDLDRQAGTGPQDDGPGEEGVRADGDEEDRLDVGPCLLYTSDAADE